jgi:hypothetical protein
VRIEFWMSGAEIQQLREAMDSLPLNPYGPVILKVLKALPMTESSAVVAPSADTEPLPPKTPREAADGSVEVAAIGRFNLEQRMMLDSLDRAIADAARRRRGNPLYDTDWTV